MEKGQGTGKRRGVKGWKGAMGGSVGERNRRGERVCLARTVPSKESRRNRLQQWKTRNSEDAHDGSFGDSMTYTS